MTIYEQCSDMSLQHVQEMCRGYRQSSQKELISSLAADFFERIEDVVNSKAWSLTRYIYLFTAPSLQASDSELAQFNALKDRLEAYTEAEKKEGTTRLIKWVKETIQDITEKRAGRIMSKSWEDSQNQVASL